MTIDLDDAIAAETKLSHVDGNNGELIILGENLKDIVKLEFEEVLSKLFKNLFHINYTHDEIKVLLAKARKEVFSLYEPNDVFLSEMPIVDAVRTLISKIKDGNDIETAIKLIAAIGVFTAALISKRNHRKLLVPDLNINHATDILRIAGLDYSEIHSTALNTYLVTIIDHGLNASTFTSRVVASTHAGLTSSVIAALSALKGPLHGGAPGPVLDMIDQISSQENALPWLETTLKKGERLMGFGHRIYKVRDPRADALKEALLSLNDSFVVDKNKLNLAYFIEITALDVLKRTKPNRPLHTNVEFYTALLLDSLGFNRADFTAIFAAGRVAGWLAHAREQTMYGRLIRPQSKYIGNLPNNNTMT